MTICYMHASYSGKKHTLRVDSMLTEEMEEFVAIELDLVDNKAMHASIVVSTSHVTDMFKCLSMVGSSGSSALSCRTMGCLRRETEVLARMAGIYTRPVCDYEFMDDTLVIGCVARTYRG